MLKKIKTLVKKAARQKSIFDPSVFNDELALKTEWGPLKSGGSNFRTHKLVSVDYNRIEFKPTIGAKLFSSVFILAGLAVPVLIGFENTENNQPLFSSDLLPVILFGLLFVGGGGFLLYKFAKPVIFDKMKGLYWKGWKVPKGYLAQIPEDDSSRISNLHAIQLIAERVRGNKRTYYSYEMNLVLKDGSRMNVIDHGNVGKLREDARILSEFLSVPVWDVGAAYEF